MTVRKHTRDGVARTFRKTSTDARFDGLQHFHLRQTYLSRNCSPVGDGGVLTSSTRRYSHEGSPDFFDKVVVGVVWIMQ